MIISCYIISCASKAFDLANYQLSTIELPSIVAKKLLADEKDATDNNTTTKHNLAVEIPPQFLE